MVGHKRRRTMRSNWLHSISLPESIPDFLNNQLAAAIGMDPRQSDSGPSSHDAQLAAATEMDPGQGDSRPNSHGRELGSINIQFPVSEDEDSGDDETENHLVARPTEYEPDFGEGSECDDAACIQENESEFCVVTEEDVRHAELRVEERSDEEAELEHDIDVARPSIDVGSLGTFATFEKMLKFYNKMLSGERMLGFISVCGSVRMTVRQYEFQRVLCKWLSKGVFDLPAYSTVQRSSFPFALRYLFPQSKVIHLPFTIDSSQKQKLRRSRAVSTISMPSDNGTSRLMGQVRVVYPSEWAKVDVATSPVFDAIFPDFNADAEAVTAPHSIERTEVVQHRENLLDATSWFFVSNGPLSHRARHGDAICVTMSRILPDAIRVLQAICGGRHQFPTKMGQLSVTFTLGAVWCVGGPDSPTESSTKALEASESQKNRKIISALSTAAGLSSEEGEVLDEDRVLPGDICGILDVSGCDSERSSFVCLLASRFLKERDGVSSHRILWYRWNKNRTRLQTWCKHTVVDTMVLANGSRRTVVSDLPPRGRDTEKNHGYLEDGTRYLVYRVILYSDDFQPKSSLNDNDSAGGIYMIPLGLPPWIRRSKEAVRLISLTPPGISSNEVLLHIISDIVDATKNGIDGFTPCGHKVQIFLDVVQYVADYPASSGVTDVVGHICNTPCTVCILRKDVTGNRSSLGYTVNQHASNSSTLRHAERQMAIHDAKVGADVCLRLGISSDTDNHAYPLVELHKALQKVRPDIPKTNDGKNVVSGLFDPYRSNAIAPDHMFNGLTKDLLGVAFSCLENHVGGDTASLNTREGMDISICQSLSENRLLRQGSVYDKHLHGMSLSELNCVLAVAVPLFAQVLDETNLVRRLLIQLQEIMALTFWWPIPEVDGKNAAAYVWGGRKDKYLLDLKRKAAEYVSLVDELWREDKERGKLLDKPNLHRLIELYEHSVPAFGHVQHFMELVFESYHQPLKRCVQKSNHRNAHLSAVEHVLGNDWQARIFALYHMSKTPGREGSAAKICLIRFLLGEEVARYLQHAGTEDEMTKVLSKVEECFIPPVLAELKSDGKLTSFLTKCDATWVGSDESKFDQTRIFGGRLLVSTVMKHATNLLNALRPNFEREQGLKWFAVGKRTRAYSLATSKEYARVNGHDKLTTGNVLQVQVSPDVRQGKVVPGCGSAKNGMALYAVIGFIKRRSEDTLWAVVLRCSTDMKGDRRYLHVSHQYDSAESIQLLEMGNSVRRVGLTHFCAHDGPCKISTSERKVTHSKGVFDYGKFLFQTRKHGYPPRMA